MPMELPHVIAVVGIVIGIFQSVIGGLFLIAWWGMRQVLTDLKEWVAKLDAKLDLTVTKGECQYVHKSMQEAFSQVLDFRERLVVLEQQVKKMNGGN